MNLRDVLTGAAAGVPDVETATGASGERIWSVGGRSFAVLDGDGSAAEFGLEPVVAAAAARTPDVVSSGRGPGWVLFRPAVVDEHAVDRAGAWFESARRRLNAG